jgi:hypothetical protein
MKMGMNVSRCLQLGVIEVPRSFLIVVGLFAHRLFTRGWWAFEVGKI